MRRPSVALVSMPWHMLGFPSIQLGTLEAVLRRAGVTCTTHTLYLQFQHFLLTRREAGGGIGLTIDDYGDVCSRWSSIGAGDWVFAVPPVRGASKERDESYLELCRKSGVPARLIRALRATRKHVPAFLEQCADEILAQEPAVVGFTSVYSQTMPSVALARLLKERAPDLKIVFGGSGCQGPMGAAHLEAFDCIDVVVRGEAEAVLPELVESLLAGAPPPPIPGLCFRTADGVETIPGQEQRVAMDDVPAPAYDEYFERLARTVLADQVLPQIPFETSRGCWWGMKAHCTFCGINGLDMAFRRKSPERVLEQVSALALRHGCLDFSAVDVILDMGYFETLLPRLAERGHDFAFFYETKANLKKEQVERLRAAGVNTITPGVESLSTSCLKLMKKGVTAFQNLRLLKWCAQLEIRVTWNLLYGFPGENPEEYERMAELVPSIVHLEAPHLGRLQMYRFSPYHDRPEEHGLRVHRPLSHYELIYDADEQTLGALAHAFEYSHGDGRDPEAYVGSLRARVRQWRDEAERNRGSLTYRRGPGFLVITDTRSTTQPARYQLTGAEATAYLACADGATRDAIVLALEAGPDPEPSATQLDRLLADLVDARLAYEEDGKFLSLALQNAPHRSGGASGDD